jgi:hypothetical protein
MLRVLYQDIPWNISCCYVKEQWEIQGRFVVRFGVKEGRRGINE